MSKTKIVGALPEASGLLNTYTKFHPNWGKMSGLWAKKTHAHIWGRKPNLIVFGP